MVVVPSLWCRAASSTRMWVRSLASRLERGSSIKKALGLRRIALPMATRCFCPPDKAAGRRLSRLVMPNISAACSTRWRISFLGTLRMDSENAMLSYTDICG